MLLSFFSSNIPLTIEKNLMESQVSLRKQNFNRTFTPVSPKLVFEKIKFEVLHYIQHDFIGQRSGFSKDHTSMSRSLVFNYFILNIATHLQKIYKHFFFYKNSCDKSYLGMKLFIKQTGYTKVIFITQSNIKNFIERSSGLLNFRGVPNGYHQYFQYFIVSIHFFP